MQDAQVTKSLHLLMPLKYHTFENIMENGVLVYLEQMLHFPEYFQNLSLFFLTFFQCCLKIENDVMIAYKK